MARFAVHACIRVKLKDASVQSEVALRAAEHVLRNSLPPEATDVRCNAERWEVPEHRPPELNLYVDLVLTGDDDRRAAKRLQPALAAARHVLIEHGAHLRGQTMRARPA